MTTALVPASGNTWLTRQEARQALAPVLAAVPRERVRQVHTNPFLAAGVVLAFAPRILGLREALARSLPDFDLAHVDNLERYARGVIDAHTDLLLCLRRDPDLARIAKFGFELRARFIASAKALAAHGLLEPCQLKKLHRPSGYLHLATDLQLLALFFERDWARLEHKTPVTRVDIEQAHRAVLALLERSGKQRRTPEALRAARDRRARAFTLLVESYGEARAAVQFLRRQQRDADSFAPPLTRRKRAKKRRARAAGGGEGGAEGSGG